MKIELRVWNKFFEQFEGKFLIGGDFNGHHHLWGSWKNFTTGNNLYHCIIELETKIKLLNDGSQTYISDAAGSKAALDLTFVDPRSALLYTWKVRTDPWNSDHYPISIEYNGIIEPGERQHNKDIGWTVFMEKVKEEIAELKTHNRWNRERDVKERYDNFIQTIKGKLEETTPKRNDKNNFGNGGQGKIGSKDKKPEFIWWNGECGKVIGIRKAKLLKWKYCKTEKTFLEYKRAAISAKNRLREIEQQNCKTFCEGIDKSTNPSYIWERMKI
jgi:hypothetical protein